MVVCSTLGLTPTHAIFLQYFNVRSIDERGWLSLVSMEKKWLLKLFSDYFKVFKTKYFKVLIRETGRLDFLNEVERPKFPFYWMRNPRKVTS